MIPDNLNLVRYNEIVKQFHDEPDRTSAILAAAFLEQCLEEYIRLLMIELPQVAVDKLFNNLSVSTFNNRINFAFACNWITAEQKKDLHTIRIIRNEFAHNPDMNEFSQIPNEPRFQGFSCIYDSESLKSQYLMAVGMTIGGMWNTLLPFLKKK
ncbi:MAG: hypothetical protein ACYS3N_06010 [Planctomycetota bacterium]|jgi:hypothetical protein